MIKIELLADRPEAVETIARWWYDEWGHEAEGNSVENTCGEVRANMNRDRAPVGVVAVDDGQVLGVAVWKPHEMLELYPEKENWLGGVYVAPEARGLGVASQLCRKVIEVARVNGVDRLHLQTEKPNGDLYARLGWQPIEHVVYHGRQVLVMSRDMKPDSDVVPT